MASSNPVKTDPTTGDEAVPVYKHGTNVENSAHPGNQASISNFPNNNTQGDKATNTSTSILGAGATGQGVDNSPGALKTPRKTDGSAHDAPGGTLHGGGGNHKDEI